MESHEEPAMVERDCQPIGDLVPRIANSVRVADSTQNASGRFTETTGSRNPAPKVSNPIGPLRGATGVAERRNLPDLLAGLDPEATDQAIRGSLPLSIRSTLRPETREFIDPVYGWDSEIIRYSLEAQPMPADLDAGRAIVLAALAPATEATIKGELARLRASTKARSEADGDLAMAMQVLADECGDWPPDVVRAALRRWARREIFFPSLAEIREELQRVGRNRRMLAAALGAAG